MSWKANHDLLTGTWEGGADDGSGLRSMIYNFGVTLNRDGTGSVFSWSKEKKVYEEERSEIEWRITETKQLEIKYKDIASEKCSWETFEIEITDFRGAYSGEYYRIVNRGKGFFWDFPEPLYKIKPVVKPNRIMDLILNIVTRK